MLIVTVICGGLVYLLGGTVVSGLRTGRIAHTNSSSFCERRKSIHLLGLGCPFLEHGSRLHIWFG